MLSERAVVPTTITLVADGFRQVEHDGDRQAVILAGEMYEWSTRFGLHVGGVNNGQPSSCQSLDVAM